MPGSMHRRAGVHLDAARAELRKARCAVIAIAFRPTMSRGRPGSVHFAGRDHRGDAAVQRRNRSSRAGSGAASSRRPPDGRGCRSGRARRGALGIDHGCRAGKVEVRRAPTAAIRPSTATIVSRVENRLLEVAAQHQTDVLIASFWPAGGVRFVMGHGILALHRDSLFDNSTRSFGANSMGAERHWQAATICASDHFPVAMRRLRNPRNRVAIRPSRLGRRLQPVDNGREGG